MRLIRHPPRRLVRAMLLLAAAAALAVPVATFAGAAPASAQSTPASAGPGLLPDPASITAGDEARCAESAYKAGFSFTYYFHANDGHTHRSILMAIAICLAESGGHPGEYYCNPVNPLHGDYPPISCPSGTTSVDRGLWMINNVFWPQVDNTCAFQEQCNAGWAWNPISQHGTDFSAWATYNNGAWTGYLSDATTGLSNLTVMLADEGTGLCLDANAQDIRNGGKIQQWTCNSSDPFQQWKVIQGAGNLNPVLENVGTVQAGNAKCLDTDASQPGDRGQIFQWACNTTTDPHQQWNVEGSGQPKSNGDAILLLHDVGNGTCLAADASTAMNGGTIWQWTCNSTNTYLQWN